MLDKILIIVPVINLWDQYTIHCMESIVANKTPGHYEILIVDNGSTDQTIEKATDFGNRKLPDRVHVLHNDHNMGCAGGWNQGVTWGIDHGFTHFLIINNDILLGPNVIEALYQRMKREPKALLVSPIDIAKEVIVPNDVLDPAHAVNNKPDTEAPNPHFSCFMITPETIEKVGWFDESFYPAYFEDNDYHYRIKLAGELAVTTTAAAFYHFGSRTQNQAAGAPITPGESFRKNEEYFRSKWGGSTGHETFTKPFNNDANDYKYAKRG